MPQILLINLFLQSVYSFNKLIQLVQYFVIIKQRHKTFRGKYRLASFFLPLFFSITARSSFDNNLILLMVLPQFIDSSNEFVDFVGNNAEINSKRFLDILCVYFVKTEGFGVFPVQRFNPIGDILFGKIITSDAIIKKCQIIFSKPATV